MNVSCSHKPDLSTLRGLRQALSEVDRLHAALDAFRQLAKRRNNPQLVAAVASILIRMCTDSILKEKLFKRGAYHARMASQPILKSFYALGLIRNLMDLLEHDLTRHMGLRLLVVFTEDGCRTRGDILEQIARYGTILTQIVRDHTTDRPVTELAVVILSHAARFVISSAPEAPPGPRQLDDMGLGDMLPTMLHVMRMPQPSRSLLTHALMSLFAPVQHIPAQCKDNDSLNTLFVALLRANQISTRAAALEGILNCQIDSEPDGYDIDFHHLAKTLKHTRPLPSILNLTESDYPRWLQQSDSAHLYEQSLRYVEAMSVAARDQDLRRLGRAIADILQSSPLLVEGNWQELEQDVVGDRRVPSDPQLSFSLWSDTLPECAKALRVSATPLDRDMADILDMSFHMSRGRQAQAAALAQETSARNPNHPYAHYVASLCGDPCQGLRAATDGLRCPDVTPSLRRQLLWRAVESGVWQGFRRILTAAIEDERAQEEGTTVLRTAWNNAQTFLAEAPQDAYSRSTILGWSLLLMITLRGPELSQNLDELEVSDSLFANGMTD